jgi:hypothetical protein
MKIKLLFVILFGCMFANTVGSVFAFAQTLDQRVAERVSMIDQMSR